MSVPAPSPRPGRGPSHRDRRDDARKSGRSPRPPLRVVERPAAGRSRRGFLPFVALAGLLVGLLVFGLVVANVLVAQSSFRLDELSRREERLIRATEERRLEVARLSAPPRIAAEARKLGLRLPDPETVVYLHLGKASSSSSGGERPPAPARSEGAAGTGDSAR